MHSSMWLVKVTLKRWRKEKGSEKQKELPHNYGNNRCPLSSNCVQMTLINFKSMPPLCSYIHCSYNFMYITSIAKLYIPFFSVSHLDHWGSQWQSAGRQVPWQIHRPFGSEMLMNWCLWNTERGTLLCQCPYQTHGITTWTLPYQNGCNKLMNLTNDIKQCYENCTRRSKWSKWSQPFLTNTRHFLKMVEGC